jgi:N-6 DNA Methylase
MARSTWPICGHGRTIRSMWQAPVGFIEIKRPGKSADPNTFRGKDAAQWKKLSLLPNVLYTDGAEWALWRSGELTGSIVRLKGSVKHAGPRLAPRDGRFLGVLREFLLWEPQPPRNIDQLVRALANLCKFLRTEVAAALELEARGHRTSLYRLLAEEWRNLLFPDEPDDEFADQYAQTVTFALLLARVQGIELEGQDLSVIAKKLRKKHLLLGRALAVLTDDVLGDLGTSLSTMIRVIGAVNWDQLVDRREDAYLWLYERFLATYDPTLRQQTGSYYTPNEVVAYLARAADELLRSRLGIRLGFAAPQVVTIDPAMGTGTFLVHVLERAANAIAADEPEGAVGPRLREIAKDRLIGFEKQIGPYAVAELRLFEALQRQESDAPAQGLRLYIADTLESPWIPQTPYSVTSIEIAKSRELANKVKLHERVLVAIGNPPHDKAPKGAGK